jgi:thymidylate kinase
MTELFIEKSKLVHGDRYDYSKVDYKNSKTKVIIICQEHGEFLQTLGNHLKYNGCPKCSGHYTLTTEEFIEKSKLVHGNRYDYSKIDYKNSNTYVTIICQEHGEFQQTPKLHLKGAGCGKCAGTSKITESEFLDKCRDKFGDLYDYSIMNYKSFNSIITIVCKIHGNISIIPKSHLKGTGCSKCTHVLNGNKRKTPLDEFIKKCREKHGDSYDYSNVNYVNNNTYIKIICKENGEFQQTPWHHLNSNGCPKCTGYYTLTTEEFIEKSKLVHGDLYDYSHVDYKNSNKEVSIVCKKHGEFLQKPVYHYWNKAGCPKCANKNITTKEFIEKIKLVHGDLYDYSNVVYSLSNETINIICEEHGEFIQRANDHLNGSGCPKCAGHCILTTEEFIEKSKLVHGDLYDYSNVVYNRSNEKVNIICKEHGEFLQKPNSHLNSHGCQKCYYNAISKRQTLTKEEFIEKSKLVHGDLYDYSKVYYTKCSENVIIGCKIHGDFLQTPIGHYFSGSGCQKCSGVAKLTTEEFIERSIKIHGDLYDYSESIYINSSTKVKIICKKHGVFNQIAGGHYQLGQGCPKCSNIGYSKPQILWLNFLSKYYNINIQHAENDGEYLIPETKYRADGFCKENNTIYEFNGDFWHGNPNIYKDDDINTITKCTYKELYEKTLKKEERLKNLGYNLVIIWEYDWKKINRCIKILQQKFRK